MLSFSQLLVPKTSLFANSTENWQNDYLAGIVSDTLHVDAQEKKHQIHFWFLKNVYKQLADSLGIKEKISNTVKGTVLLSPIRKILCSLSVNLSDCSERLHIYMCTLVLHSVGIDSTRMCAILI